MRHPAKPRRSVRNPTAVRLDHWLFNLRSPPPQYLTFVQRGGLSPTSLIVHCGALSELPLARRTMRNL